MVCFQHFLNMSLTDVFALSIPQFAALNKGLDRLLENKYGKGDSPKSAVANVAATEEIFKAAKARKKPGEKLTLNDLFRYVPKKR